MVHSMVSRQMSLAHWSWKQTSRGSPRGTHLPHRRNEGTLLKWCLSEPVAMPSACEFYCTGFGAAGLARFFLRCLACEGNLSQIDLDFN
mmetsp:Transcript_68827/g.138385  ORF Transcript_68827/g.138385 Transcript_68827/m.138385 type:complete len:89 (+) Transcript_68827:639-905(+)